MITVEQLQIEIGKIKDLPLFDKMLEFASLLTEYFNETSATYRNRLFEIRSPKK